MRYPQDEHRILQAPRLLRCAWLLVAASILTTCGDSEYSRVTVVAPYKLSHEDPETPDQYLLVGGPPDQEDSPWQIGWNSRYIVYTPDSRAWYVIDAPERLRRGPYTHAELENRPELREIKAIAAADAYKELRSGRRR